MSQTYTPLVGEITTERLREWSAAQAGRPNVGPARALIRQYFTDHVTLDRVLAAIGEYERISEQRTRRHELQIWVSSNLRLTDGQIIADLRVWNPERGEFVIPTGQFVVKAPRGAATYHVMVRELGRDYSRKIGSIMEV